VQNRLTRATLDFGRRKANRSAALALVLRDTASGFFTTARHALMITGLFALAVAGLVLARPELGERALAMMSLNPQQAEATEEPSLTASLLPLPEASAEIATSGGDDELQRQQQRVASWIARRYRVANDATQMFVSTAYQTAKELKIDPLLILSVMAIESRFNPFAESPVGAQGLMQVMSRVHKDKFEPLGGVEAALNPVANIKVGARILKEYMTRGGSVEAGLKMYVGAALLKTDFGYGAKVLAEYARMKDVAMGRKVSIYARTVAVPKPEPKDQAAARPASDTVPAEPGQPWVAQQLASAL
jgi:soluble lytic murein transglycosylase-like protein